jgi:hypothetical protein
MTPTPLTHSLGSGHWSDSAHAAVLETDNDDTTDDTADDTTLGPGWTKEAIHTVRRSWNLSVDQHAALVQLGRRLYDVNHHKNSAVEVIRFLEDRSWNGEAAEAMFRKSMVWRQEMGADDVLERFVPPKHVIDNIPGAILNNWDKEGDPIFMDCVVQADCAAIINRYGPDMLVQHAIWIRETISKGKWLEEYQNQQGRPVRQILIISDLNGLSRRHLNRKVLSVFGAVTRLDQDNYPGVAKKIVLIRTPIVFRLVWGIVKHFFDPHVAAKMVFCGKDNYRQVLAEYVDLKVLPSAVVQEGEGAAIEGMPQNWNGGPLPPL